MVIITTKVPMSATHTLRNSRYMLYENENTYVLSGFLEVASMADSSMQLDQPAVM